MSIRKARGFKTSKCSKEAHECEDQPNEKIGLCITHLPNAMSIDILSRLPLPCLLSCRCVCQAWRNLIKDSEFAKLHLSRAEAYPLIRSVGPTYVSRTLYFVDQPPESELCYNSRSNQFEPKVNMKLNIKMKIPLNNVELAITESEANMNLHSKRKRVTKLRRQDHKLNVVNACNGFLCLSEPLRKNPVMVCNPITGERIDCGLGFCSQTKQYKVIRMFSPGIRERNLEAINGRKYLFCWMAELNTLGTDTWKMVGYAPTPSYKLKYCTYLNGTLHNLVNRWYSN